MRLLDDLRPPGGGPPDWDRLAAEHLWVRELGWCDQDPDLHREGSVLEHVRRVHAHLLALPAFQRLPPRDKDVLELAALLHDAGKPATTRVIGGRIRAPGHPARGEILARRILWEEGVPFGTREAVCALVRFHHEPFELLARPDAQKQLFRISVVSRCDHLAILAEADARGRDGEGREEAIGSVGLFREYAGEQGCTDRPFPFPSDHSRFLYFRKEDRNPFYEAHDDTRGEALLLSGLPGAGKSTWVAHRAPAAYEVIGLDETRESMGVAHTDPQGAVVRRTREQAKRIMGAKHERRSFVWNATNVRREWRSRLIDLVARYNYRVRIVYLEVPPDDLHRRNAERESPVPASAMEHMLWHWTLPDRTEAHDVRYLVRSTPSGGG